MKAGTLLRTLSHLRWEQVVSQLRVRRRRWIDKTSAARNEAAPPLPGVRWEPVTNWLPPGPPNNPRDTVLAGRLTFLNETRHVGFPPRWSSPPSSPPPSKLWLYNLHYLEYLWPLPYPQATNLVRNWIEQYPLERGAAGWDPYPTSLRLMNLVAYFFSPQKVLMAADDERADPAPALWQSRRSPGRMDSKTPPHMEGRGRDVSFRNSLWASLYRQTTWLSSHLETHLLGNHLLENAIALAFIGACFEGDAAAQWRRQGQILLERELPEQVLPDGMHFERSSMYQARLTYALAMLANTGDAQIHRLVADPLLRMHNALKATTHPDGGIALLNDAAFGIYHRPGELLSFVQKVLQLEPTRHSPTLTAPTSLPDAGYYLAHNDNDDYLICDAGALGPDYQPGHAHCDIFSFELSLAGRRVITDGGTCGYQRSSLRQYCRSVRAHNTVQVGEADQAELWAAFRMGRRGRPRDVSHDISQNHFTLEGWHDGYRHLRGRPVHQRRFTWHESGTLLIRDEVTARSTVAVTSRLHLHPDCEVVDMDHRRVRVARDDLTFWIWFDGDADGPVDGSVATHPYCPRFGKSYPAPVVTFRWRGMTTRHALAITRLAEADGFSMTRGLHLRQPERTLGFELP